MYWFCARIIKLEMGSFQRWFEFFNLICESFFIGEIYVICSYCFYGIINPLSRKTNVYDLPLAGTIPGRFIYKKADK